MKSTVRSHDSLILSILDKRAYKNPTFTQEELDFISRYKFRDTKPLANKVIRDAKLIITTNILLATNE